MYFVISKSQGKWYIANFVMRPVKNQEQDGDKENELKL